MNRSFKIRKQYVETGKAKIPSVLEYLGHLYESTDKKMIVFAYHHEMLDAIEKQVVKNKVRIFDILVYIEDVTVHSL